MKVDTTSSPIESANIEQAVFEYFRVLPLDQQQEVLNFVEFLAHKLASRKSKSLTLLEIAQLSVIERHKLLAPSIPGIVDDFQRDPEMMEFSVLDGEDWEIANG